MLTTIQRWLTAKWRVIFSGDEVVQCYGIVFQSPQGQVVLQHMVDNIYCRVCESPDPIALATHNGRRSVIHEILINIDLAQNKSKYNVQALVESSPGFGVN